MALHLQIASVTDSKFIVAVRGEIDLYSAAQLWQALEDLAAGARSVIVDLTAVTFIDSTGVGILVSAAKLFRLHEGEIYTVALPPVSSTLEDAGLKTFLNVERTLREALERAR